MLSNFAFAKAAGVPDWGELQQLQSSSRLWKLWEWSGMFVVKRSTCRNKVGQRGACCWVLKQPCYNEISHQQTDVANQRTVKLTSADNWTVQLCDTVRLPVSLHVAIISVYVNSSAVSRMCFLTREAVVVGEEWGTGGGVILVAIMQIGMNEKFSDNSNRPVWLFSVSRSTFSFLMRYDDNRFWLLFLKFIILHIFCRIAFLVNT